MKKRYHSICVLLFFLSFHFDLLLGQSPLKKVFPRWTSYTNGSYVKDLVLDKNILWAAAGGVIKIDLDKGTRVKYLREHGLASNNVLKMALHDNTLWIATANGITCHHINKNTWKSFYKTDGLPDDAVTAITIDTANNLTWFGTWEGYLFNFNTFKKKWNFFKTKIKIPDTIISSLAVDTVNGLLMIGTWGKGLYTYKPGSQRPIKQKWVHNSLDFISALLLESGTLWIGTVNNGLWAVDLRKEPLEPGKTGNLPDGMITGIKAPPGKNRVFITTAGSGLLIYSKTTGEWKTVNTNQGIPTELLNTSANDGENIFLGSDGEGIIKLNLKTGKMNQYKSSNEIANNKVSVVTPDPLHNRLWIGTEGNGAASLDLLSGKWSVLNSANHILCSDVVNCITVDSGKDAAWIGTDNGMVKYETRSGNHQRYGIEEDLSGVMVYASGFDHLNRIWAAFYIGSPAVFNPRAKKWQSLENLPGVTCYALSMDKKGKSVWMATTQGIMNVNIETNQNKNYWRDMEFRSVLFDAGKREIWAGSWGEGLFHMAIGSRQIQRHKIKEFENLAVLDIKKDEMQDIIWFATNAGVFFLEAEEQKFGHLDVSRGLGLNYVLSIGITADSIWFGTWGGGLSRFLK